MQQKKKEIRKGPYKRVPFGNFRGYTIEELIDSSPKEFVLFVKRWLNVTPEQATYFSNRFGGAEIPEKYIKEFDKREECIEDIPELEDLTFDQLVQKYYYDLYIENWRKAADNSILPKIEIPRSLKQRLKENGVLFSENTEH